MNEYAWKFSYFKMKNLRSFLPETPNLKLSFHILLSQKPCNLKVKLSNCMVFQAFNEN